MGGSQLAATALGKPMPGKSRSPFSQYAAAWKAAIPVSASRRALTGNAAILAAGRRPGRHLAASRSSALAKTPRTPKTPRTVAGWACAPGHWPAQSHWDNGRPARCVDCPWAANATRKCALSQWACSQREAPSRRCLGCLGCSGCLGQGAGARSGLVPASATGPSPR